jgi:tRNA dimethylallyltransferase
VNEFPNERALVVVLGPTGSGKSELALDLAERWNGEIVNYDSVQVYRGFDVGAAKLPEAERRGIPHHLLDVAGPDSEFTAGDFARLARITLTQISSRDRLPVLCGGTGFYLRALLHGLSPAPQRDARIRERLAHLARRRPEALHRLLRHTDPAAASRIHRNDVQKMIRALEITMLERSPASAIQQRPRDPLRGYRTLKLGLDPDRQLLYEALNKRTVQLFERGLVEESRKLLEAGYTAGSKPMQSLGYRQALDVIAGTKSFEAAIIDCQAKTRQYAKRQMTWFRAEPDVHWMKGFGSERAVRGQALQLTNEFLKVSTDE